jgi:hypothetical protein
MVLDEHFFQNGESYSPAETQGFQCYKLATAARQLRLSLTGDATVDTWSRQLLLIWFLLILVTTSLALGKVLNASSQSPQHPAIIRDGV